MIAAIVAARWAKHAAISTNEQASVAKQELIEARNANALPVLIQLFAEQRSPELTAARDFVVKVLPSRATPNGLDDLSSNEREMVRNLSYFYDNLGSLVAHGIVDVRLVSGFLGGSVITTWNAIEHSIVEPERRKRSQDPGAVGWQVYFENLVLLVRRNPPQQSWRTDLWLLP